MQKVRAGLKRIERIARDVMKSNLPSSPFSDPLVLSLPPPYAAFSCLTFSSACSFRALRVYSHK